jgi:hypothetical protein
MAKKREKSDRLRALVDEALVDCYSEDECQVGKPADVLGRNRS